MGEIVVRHIPPEVDDYLRLRKITGLRERTRAAAEIGLNNGLFAISLLTEGGEVVGMGRVVGDGGCNFEVVDIAVDPEYQGQGLGRKIMEQIMAYLHATVPKGSYVSLIASSPRFYEEFGFEQCAPRWHGMQIKW